MAITVCVFDAYGTLFDVASAARRLADRPEFGSLRESWPALAATWRAKQLQYSWLRAITHDHVDFWTVTQDSLDWALESVGLEHAGLRAALLDLYRRLDAYPEVRETLGEIRRLGKRTAILSNGSPDMLDDAVESAGLAGMFDAILSVESVGVFKPDPAVYALVEQTFGCKRAEVLFVSSNGWDVGSAAAFGFDTLWVNRAGEPVERLPGRPARVARDLAAIRDMIGPG